MNAIDEQCHIFGKFYSGILHSVCTSLQRSSSSVVPMMNWCASTSFFSFDVFISVISLWQNAFVFVNIFVLLSRNCFSFDHYIRSQLNFCWFSNFLLLRQDNRPQTPPFKQNTCEKFRVASLCAIQYALNRLKSKRMWNSTLFSEMSLCPLCPSVWMDFRKKNNGAKRHNVVVGSHTIHLVVMLNAVILCAHSTHNQIQ